MSAPRTAVVTGGGRGLGRAHALVLAATGHAVVVNDLGRSLAGEGEDLGPAQHVVAEIERLGGRAVTNHDDVADWDGAAALVVPEVRPVLGRVSMDMLTVDLTPCPGAGIGSRVELWGANLPIDDVAAAAGTIGYELMCAIAQRVPVRAE